MRTQKGMIMIAGLAAVLGLSQCGNTEHTQEKPGQPAEQATPEAGKKEAEKPEVKAGPEPVKYTAYPLKKVDTAVKAFKAKYTGRERWTILALNRIDEANMKRADTLIIPEEIRTDFNAYSPFPVHMPSLKDVHKIVLFSYTIQAFAAYEQGNLVYWGPTSMGSKVHPTPTGLHFANWKAKETTSTVDDEWKLKWNFNIENKEGVGWHQYALPGYPASHSCLRMLEQQAQWMYSWADQWIVKGQNTVLAQGTPVIVYGAYVFGSRRPWLHQLDDPKANLVSEANLDKEIQPFIQRIMEQQDRRNKVQGGQATSQDSSKSVQ